MKLPFREHHLLQLLSRFDAQHLPLDLFICHYFRAHSSLGSKDRGEISENVYTMVRLRGLLDYFAKEHSWEKRYEIFRELDIVQASQDPSIPAHIRVSFPKKLFDIICRSYGEQKTHEICIACNQQAPTTVRVNQLKISRDELLKEWQNQFSVSPTLHSPWGIRFHKKINFFSLPEFKAGLFEVQDEGSQLVAALVKATSKDWVLDYCAGSGGKTLAFGMQMQGQGQVYLHDIRPHALIEAKRRLKRAGIQNGQIVLPHELDKLKNLQNKMHWILVDAPCSGTGTLRRNPDMKWRFQEEALKRLIHTQREIFGKALSYLHPGGKIVYATCSILKEENEEQLDYFLKTYPLQIVTDPFSSLPTPGEMDGFFGVTLKFKPPHLTCL